MSLCAAREGNVGWYPWVNFTEERRPKGEL